MVEKSILVTSRSRLGTAEIESLGSTQHVSVFSEEDDFFLVCGADNLL